MQLVGGEVTCFVADDEVPFLVFVSVRGDEWEVRADDEGLLAAVRAAFPGSTNLPPGDLDRSRLCRVCGNQDLDLPWGADGRTPSFAFCPCCGVEWGYQDSSPVGAARFREAWLSVGAPWRDPAIRADGLTSVERLRRLGPSTGGQAADGRSEG
ncbi:hypothetical protein [Terracoccus luteus]|uniref:Uncharacterized protein n=1 Tax=Terracoccus luteus TaxID=53356 RepID=A0A839PTG0_9MICO|nr:hypothetical protein [Terracoccus luteus]MBB2987548.1 hypothetical protein [Terracoccus luteus]MCP2173199.1 hypothetical protein [Terracoccus luteus]